MSKIDRLAVHAKYGGHCAYCGGQISLSQMHVDHIVPKRNAYLEQGLENDRLENLNPACRQCNNFKTTFGIEGLRHELEMQVDRLILRSSQFRRALTFGQVQVTGKPVRFYFEGGQK